MTTTQSTRIVIEPRQTYGMTRYYIISEQAEAVSMMTGRKTIEPRDVRALERLGFSLVVAMPGAMVPASEVI